MTERIRSQNSTDRGSSLLGALANSRTVCRRAAWFRASVAVLLLSATALWAGPMKGQGPGNQLAGIAMVLVFAVCVEVGLLATALLYAVLEPERVRAGSALQAQSVFRSFGIGVLMAIILLLACALMDNMPGGIGGLLGVPLLAAYAYLFIMGFTMVAHCVGDRIQSNIASRTTGSSFFAVLYGGSILLLTNFVPVVGQLVLLVVLVLSLGAAMRSVGVRRRAKKAARAAAQAVSEDSPDDSEPETTS